MTLVISLAMLIGLLLGLFGGGGGILTVPVLVYVAGLDPKQAIVTSLVVVGITSLIAVIHHFRRGMVCWKMGMVFGVAGIAGAFSGGRLAGWIPGKLLLVLFGFVMLGAALAMLRKQRPVPVGGDVAPTGCPSRLPIAAILVDGFMVGLLTGLVGVGGGFLLVPTLIFLAGLPMHAAVGTSLLIITLQSAAGLAGHANHMAVDPVLTGVVTGFAVVGSFIGGFLSRRIKASRLKQAFGLFVLILAGFQIYREADLELLRQVETLISGNREFFLGVVSAVLLMLMYRLWHWIHSHLHRTEQ